MSLDSEAKTHGLAIFNRLRNRLKSSIFWFHLETKNSAAFLQSERFKIFLKTTTSLYNPLISVCPCPLYSSWVSVLQNSKEEALNTALVGDQLHLQDSGLQELSRSIIAELRQMPGNEACTDCGAPGRPVIVVEDRCATK